MVTCIGLSFAITHARSQNPPALPPLSETKIQRTITHAKPIIGYKANIGVPRPVRLDIQMDCLLKEAEFTGPVELSINFHKVMFHQGVTILVNGMQVTNVHPARP